MRYIYNIYIYIRIVYISGGHYITHLGENKQYKSIVIFRDFPHYNALFGLVI